MILESQTRSMDVPTGVMLGLGLAGIVTMTILMGLYTQDKNNGADIKLNLGIIAGVTGVLILMFGAGAYMYFTANVNYLPPFLIVMSFLNLYLSLFAVSAASLQVTSS